LLLLLLLLRDRNGHGTKDLSHVLPSLLKLLDTFSQVLILLGQRSINR
jgi:hypothetical protein